MIFQARFLRKKKIIKNVIFKTEQNQVIWKNTAHLRIECGFAWKQLRAQNNILLIDTYSKVITSKPGGKKEKIKHIRYYWGKFTVYEFTATSITSQIKIPFSHSQADAKPKSKE